MSNKNKPSLLEKYFFPGENHLRKPFAIYIIGIILFIPLTSLLFYTTNLLNDFFPNHKASLSMLPALILPAWTLLGYQFFRHYDELQKKILLKAAPFSVITGMTLLLASSFRQTIGGVEAIDEAIIIVVMTLTWVICTIYLNLKLGGFK